MGMRSVTKCTKWVPVGRWVRVLNPLTEELEEWRITGIHFGDSRSVECFAVDRGGRKGIVQASRDGERINFWGGAV